MENALNQISKINFTIPSFAVSKCCSFLLYCEPIYSRNKVPQNKDRKEQGDAFITSKSYKVFPNNYHSNYLIARRLLRLGE